MQKLKSECQVTGLYLGWDIPERGWHPLMKLERSSRGYESLNGAWVEKVKN